MNTNDKKNRRTSSDTPRPSTSRPRNERSTREQRPPRDKGREQSNRHQPRPHRKQNETSSNLKLTYIAIITVMLIFLVLFLILQFKYFFGVKEQEISEIISKNNDDKVIEQLEKESALNYTDMTGIVKEINKNSLVLYDINTGNNIEIYVDNKTTLTDAYGKNIILPEIEIGDGFLITYQKDTKIAKNIEVADDYYEHRNITGVVVDETSPLIYVKGRTYSYGLDTISLFKSEPISIDEIDPKDAVTLKVIGDYLHYIAIEKEHGGLNILNGSHIENGTIEVDTDKIYYISDVSTITLSEGSHRIVVKGTNIEPYIYDLIITNSDYSTLDLANVQEKTSNVHFNLNVEDAKITINDEVYENYISNEPINVPYGTYTFKVEKDSYIPFESTLLVNSISETVNINLEEIRLDSTIYINTTPEGASVHINNEYIGLSPISKSVDYGTYNVTLTLDGYKQISFTVDAVDSIHKYNVGLQKEE